MQSSTRFLALAALLLCSVPGLGQDVPFPANMNRQPRIGTADTIAIVSVEFQDTQHAIDPATHLQFAQDLKTLLVRNSHGRYAPRVEPTPDDDVARYRIQLPAATCYYTNVDLVPANNKAIALLLDVKRAFAEAPDPLDFDDYTRVVYYFAGPDGPQPIGDCNPAGFPLGLSASAQGLKYAAMTNPQSLAAGALHEIGHTYWAAHAACWEAAVPTGMGAFDLDNAVTNRLFCDAYEDPFDYMGLGGCCAPRFTAPVAFAAPDDIYASPIRMFMHSWIDETEVLKVNKDSVVAGGQYTLVGISDNPLNVGVRMLQIPRGWVPYSGSCGTVNVPEVLTIYLRDNEPLTAGVSVQVGSTDRQGIPIKLVSYVDHPALCTGTGASCAPPTTPPSTIPCENSFLTPMQELHDPISGVTVEVLGVTAATQTAPATATVQLSFDAGPAVINDHVPVVDFASLGGKLNAGEVYTGSEKETLAIGAYDPDYTGPGAGGPFAGIAKLRIRVRVPNPGIGQCQSAFDRTYFPPFHLGGTPPGGTLPPGYGVWDFDLQGILAEANISGRQAIGLVEVTAWSVASDDAVNTGGIRFLLDQVGPPSSVSCP